MYQKQPKVSVVIPVYNADPYLRECMDSVVSQTLRDIEIICVDDGSTDSSLAILREYERKDERVSVLTQPNINAGAARNRGLRHAVGEYLSFLDADDFFEPDMLEKAYAKAKEQAAEICVYHCDFFNTQTKTFEGEGAVLEENLPEKRPFAGTDVKKDLFRTFVGWAWDKLFLREFIVENKILFQEHRTSDDLLFTYFALAKAERITILDDVFAHHRTHVKTSQEATRSTVWENFYKALCALRSALQDADLYTRFERDFINYSLNFSLWNLYTLDWPVQESLYYALKLQWFRDLGLLEHDEAYFYDKNEYKLLQSIMEKPYSDESPEIMRQRLAELEQWMEDIKASASFRIGRAITWLPRKVRGGVRCYREHGAAYTARQFVKHLTGKASKYNRAE